MAEGDGAMFGLGFNSFYPSRGTADDQCISYFLNP